MTPFIHFNAYICRIHMCISIYIRGLYTNEVPVLICCHLYALSHLSQRLLRMLVYILQNVTRCSRTSWYLHITGYDLPAGVLRKSWMRFLLLWFQNCQFNFQRQGFNNWNCKKGLNCRFTFGLEKSVREEDKI